MLASGNGHPMQCVANLVRITRGECVYERVKGIDPTLIDKPASIAKPLLIADAKWLIKTYEPRVNIDTINIEEIVEATGMYAFSVDATVTG